MKTSTARPSVSLLTGVDVGWHGTRERGGLDQDPLTVGAKIGFSF